MSSLGSENDDALMEFGWTECAWGLRMARIDSSDSPSVVPFSHRGCSAWFGGPGRRTGVRYTGLRGPWLKGADRDYGERGYIGSPEHTMRTWKLSYNVLCRRYSCL